MLGQTLAQAGIEDIDMGQKHGFAGFQLRTEARHGTLDEKTRIGRGAEQRADFFPFRRHFLWLHRVLRETRPRLPFILGSVPPPGFHSFHAFLETKIERELGASTTAQHHRRHQCVRHRPALLGERHGHACRLADFLGFAKDDLKHGAVDGAIRREHHDRPDKVRRLPETIDAPFALLMPGRVP